MDFFWFFQTIYLSNWYNSIFFKFLFKGKNGSEAKFLEEPWRISNSVSCFELFLNMLSDRDLSGCKVGSIDNSSEINLGKRNIHRISCWHQVICVDNFDEWLYSRAPCNFDAAHACLNLAWISINSSNKRMGCRCRSVKKKNLLYFKNYKRYGLSFVPFSR